ncbi:MAG: DUF1344 domain-containing protein [Hyphomicrobiales bacterium]|nr:DUF1344 domain-containing protein [Hyphomicrobiales bacterium]
MRGFTFSLVLAGFLAAAGAAAADDVEGTIKKIDAENGVLVLADGSKFVIPDEFNIDGLEPGVKVLVFYDTVDGKKTLANVETVE